MEINSKNALGWLRLIREVYPLTDNQREKLDNFLNRTDIARRQKEIDEIFGGNYD